MNSNIMELWLFDTCNFRCGYCGLVESGAVMETSQLAPYRDEAHIQKILSFFADNRPGGRNWMVQLTGGEPMMMPNLDHFVRELGRSGDQVAIYSNGSVPVEKVLSPEALRHIAYIQLSFHPDWHVGKFSAEKFFANATLLKEAEVPCLVRFVGVPAAFHLLPELEARCKEIGVGFLPTTLFDPRYPKAYTKEQKDYLASFMSGYSSLLQLDGGVFVGKRGCVAADRLYAARLHKGADVTPCISVMDPVLGNVFENTLKPIPGKKPCYKGDSICSCDVHFQQNIVDGVDDADDFAAILAGQTPKRHLEYERWKSKHNIRTSDNIWVGQGTVAHETRGLLLNIRKS